LAPQDLRTRSLIKSTEDVERNAASPALLANCGKKLLSMMVGADSSAGMSDFLDQEASTNTQNY
jgi:hypothetical protein